MPAPMNDSGARIDTQANARCNTADGSPVAADTSAVYEIIRITGGRFYQTPSKMTDLFNSRNVVSRSPKN